MENININNLNNNEIKYINEYLSKLQSYPMLLLLIFITMSIFCILYFIYPNIFEQSFVIELIISFVIVNILTTLILSIKDTYSNQKTYNVIYIMAIILMFTLLNEYMNYANQNNRPLIWTILIFLIIYGVGSKLYLSKLKLLDMTLLNVLPDLKKIYNGRFNWTLIAISIIMIIGIMITIFPTILQQYAGFISIGIVFILIISIVMIFIYQSQLNNPIDILNFDSTIKQDSWRHVFTNGLYIFLGIMIVSIILYLLFTYIISNTSSALDVEYNSIVTILLHVIISTIIIYIIYKLLSTSKDSNIQNMLSSMMQLLYKFLIFIPNILLVSYKYIMSQISSLGRLGSITDFYILGFILLGIAIYVSFEKFLHPFIKNNFNLQGGMQLINQPVRTNSLLNIASAYQLTNKKIRKYKYNYALSFWVYIDSFAPTTHDVISILSYGGNPNVSYDATNNELLFTVKQISQKRVNKDLEYNTEIENNFNEFYNTQDFKQETEIPNELDKHGNMILYKEKNIKMQKWNHYVINYAAGTMDIFCNGELVKSVNNVVPFMDQDMLTVGSDNGANANICNLIYFDKVLDITTINTLYASLKNQNPPCNNTSKVDIIKLPIVKL